LFHPRAPLQGLHSIEHQDRPALFYQRRQPLPLVPRGARAWILISEPVQRRVDELVRRGEPVGPLAVERPPEHLLGATPPGVIHPAQPRVHQRALTDAAPGDDGGDADAFGPARVEPVELGVAAEEVAAGDGEPPDGEEGSLSRGRDARRRALRWRRAYR